MAETDAAGAIKPGNPTFAAMVGEYADALARGIGSPGAIAVRERYADNRDFAVCADALDGIKRTLSDRPRDVREGAGGGAEVPEELRGVIYPDGSFVSEAADHPGSILIGVHPRHRERADRLERAIRDAIEAAEEEGIHRHRGTDEPRRFVEVLRGALEGEDS